MLSPEMKLKSTNLQEMHEEYEDDISSMEGEIDGGGKHEPKGRTYLQVQEDIVIKDNMPPNVTTNVLMANVKPSVVQL